MTSKSSCPDEAAECGLCSRETPEKFVARLARQKAANVVPKISAGLVLGCDTVAECDGQILGKPADEEHARHMLQMLSGREHRVLSGLCLWNVPAAAIPWSVLPSLACGWIAFRPRKSTTTWPAGFGKARPGPSATRTAWAGSMLWKAARRMSSGCRWNCWQKCWGDRTRQRLSRIRPITATHDSFVIRHLDFGIFSRHHVLEVLQSPDLDLHGCRLGGDIP